MKYFRMNFRDYTTIANIIWSTEDHMEWSRTAFHVSAEGMDTSIWIEDPQKESFFRATLNRSAISFEEGDKQQVRTWLDDINIM